MTKQQSAAQAENQDFLTAFSTKSARFLNAHRTPVAATVLIVLVVILGINLAIRRNRQFTEDTWAAYYQAQVAMAQQGEEAGMAKLDEVAAQYPGSAAAEYAQLFKADRLYAAENFAQAAKIYEGLVSSKNETVRTVASLSYAAALQATQDYDGSIRAAQDFITNNPTSFALPQAYLTLALSQELAGKKDEAVENYKFLLENYTNSYFGTFAKDKLSQLQKK